MIYYSMGQGCDISVRDDGTVEYKTTSAMLSFLSSSGIRDQLQLFLWIIGCNYFFCYQFAIFGLQLYGWYKNDTKCLTFGQV